ncbi:hypothetical protein QYE76_051654 [Lolium multiflorum]|uniref:Retrotransposon gag domain-containing protein n=1 Tax=Lolium multiflorum TaxID=4521 RepID=A0AAD8STR0_LOLMU|nr:hypothetical protein QYE76_051654 [Lolium multiflorum]
MWCGPLGRPPTPPFGLLIGFDLKTHGEKSKSPETLQRAATSRNSVAGARRSFLDATIAKSRQIENTETPNENAATPVNSPESVEYSSDDLDEDYVELDDDFIEKCNATTDARKIKKLLAEHAVRYKLSPDPKFATSPINIRDKDYDFSLDLSHIAIVEKTPFCGTEKESAVEHMTELSTLSGLFSDDIKMRTYFVAKIFPFSLKDDAKTWYNNLSPGSIKSPKELLDVFFRKYFPASAQHAALQRIYNFDQEDGEKLPEAWARFCSLIRAQPDHDLEKHDLLDIFYSGLTIESRAYLDSCAGCVFRKRTPDDAEELLAKIGRNHDDWSTPEPTPTPIVKKRGMIKLNDEDMREAKKSLKEKGIKPEDVKNLPPIEDLCEITPPSSMIEDPLYPEGHPKRVEQDSQLIKTSAPSKKKKKKHKNVVESSEPVNDPNSISISDAETESGNEHDKDNDKDDIPDKEEIEKEPEKHAKNKKYTKEDFITEKHGPVRGEQEDPSFPRPSAGRTAGSFPLRLPFRRRESGGTADLCARRVDSRGSLSSGGAVVVEALSGGIRVSPLIPHRGGVPRGVVGELEAECAHGSGGSMGPGFLGGWCGGGADPFVDFVLGFRRRGRDFSIAAMELLRFCTGVGLAVCRHTSEAGFSDVGAAEAEGRRRCFPSILSIGFSGVATRTSSGRSPADDPQRRQLRRLRRVRIEVHKAAVTARVLLRASVCWLRLFSLRRFRRRRMQGALVGVLAKRSSGLLCNFRVSQGLFAKCRYSCVSGVFVWFLRL